MEVKRTALSIARCDNYSNEICKGFIEYQDKEGCRHLPEPWNGDIEKAKYLVISSNPSYDAKEKYPKSDDTDDEIYSYFKNRFIDPTCKSFNEVSFWRTINKWIHWIECIESGEKDINKIIEYHVRRKLVSYYDEICITEVCHCKSVKQMYVGDYVSRCVDKHLDSVLRCYSGKYVLVVGAVARDYLGRIRKLQPDAIVFTAEHPSAHGIRDVDRINSFIKHIAEDLSRRAET